MNYDCSIKKRKGGEEVVMPIKKLTKKLRKSQDTSLLHDSRADVRSIMEVCNELTDKVNEIIEFLNEQERRR